MIGKVIWYNIKQGYGFIKGSDGKDVFVHRTEVPFWSIFLKKGDKVKFIPEKTSRGIKATKLTIL